MGRTVFRELQEAIKSKEYMELSVERMECLVTLDRYIRSGKWWDSKRCDLLLSTFDLPASIAARRLGISEKGVRSNRSHASARLRRMIGDNFVLKVLRGTDAEFFDCRDTLNVLLLGVTSKTNLLSPVYDRVVEAIKGVVVKDAYDIGVDDYEVKLLRVFTETTVDSAISKLDVGYLAYLMNILDSTDIDLLPKKKLLLALLG